jgi:hypothetical protein
LFSPLIGLGIDSYGWGNENILRGINIASKFHSSHNDYLNFLLGNGLYLFLQYVYIHIAIIIKNQYNSWILLGIMTILMYKNFQEWTYINAIVFPFLWIVYYSLRKHEISLKIFFPIIPILILSFIFFPQKINPGFGIFVNPLYPEKKGIILYGDFYRFEGNGVEQCKEFENNYKGNLSLFNIFINTNVVDPESRKKCKY